MNNDLPSPSVPHYPTNEQASQFIVALHRQSVRTFFAMRDAIKAHIGTPQANQDWTRPDEWIPKILSGEEKALAFHIWQASNQVVNPRHVTGVWLLCSQHNLLQPDMVDELHASELGKHFVENPEGEIAQRVDYREGLLNLLLIISEKGQGKRSDYLPAFSDFLLDFSKYRSQASINMAWSGRIANLVSRGYVERSGVTYEITTSGLAYLERVATLLQQSGREAATDRQLAISKLIKSQLEDVQDQMLETLLELAPFDLEILIRNLLQAMSYDNVEVTSKSSDGGVDVVADIEVGITSVREVVQVKRWQNNVQRKTLDELRGSLHRFEATRGTIVTTSDFTSGARDAAFERGAAPITLINGERLVNLLIEHNLGVRKRSMELLEFEPVYFESLGSED